MDERNKWLNMYWVGWLYFLLLSARIVALRFRVQSLITFGLSKPIIRETVLLQTFWNFNCPLKTISIKSELLKSSFLGSFIFSLNKWKFWTFGNVGIKIKDVCERQLICWLCICNCTVFCDSFYCRWTIYCPIKAGSFGKSANLLNTIETCKNDTLRRPRFDSHLRI